MPSSYTPDERLVYTYDPPHVHLIVSLRALRGEPATDGFRGRNTSGPGRLLAVAGAFGDVTSADVYMDEEAIRNRRVLRRWADDAAFRVFADPADDDRPVSQISVHLNRGFDRGRPDIIILVVRDEVTAQTVHTLKRSGTRVVLFKTRRHGGALQNACDHTVDYRKYRSGPHLPKNPWVHPPASLSRAMRWIDETVAEETHFGSQLDKLGWIDPEAGRELHLILHETPTRGSRMIATLLDSPDNRRPSRIVQAALLALASIPADRPRDFALDTDALFLNYLEHRIPILDMGLRALDILVEAGYLRANPMGRDPRYVEYTFTKPYDHPTHRLARRLVGHDSDGPRGGCRIPKPPRENESSGPAPEPNATSKPHVRAVG